MRLKYFLIWLFCALSFLGAVGLYQWQGLNRELEAQSTLMHRLASQRADQHDAHLTSLSALASAGVEPPADLFMELAATIMRFYPRISDVDLIPLTAPGPALSSRAPSLRAEPLADLIRAQARQSSGELRMTLSPGRPGHYLLVKRSPNTQNPRFGLALDINAQVLLATDSEFWERPGVSVELSLADSARIYEKTTSAEAPAWGLRPVSFERTLGSNSQPLVLKTRIRPGLSDLLPAGIVVPGIALISAALAFLFALRGLLVRMRSAERRARFGEESARIAHASRINALGEMASGIAHEVTQPLTAILSQSQAGLRLLGDQSGNAGAIAGVLEANVVQAKRASQVIARLRHWAKPQAGLHSPISVNAAIDNVVFLLSPDAEKQNIRLETRTAGENPSVVADAVELEQVIFNIARNAMDALGENANGDGRILISSRMREGVVEIAIADNGPGVPEHMRPHLFEPFVSGKPDGMGLGLALCERLVERFGGRIAVDEATNDGAVFRLELPVSTLGKQVS